MLLELLATLRAGLFAGAAIYITLVEHKNWAEARRLYDEGMRPDSTCHNRWGSGVMLSNNAGVSSRGTSPAAPSRRLVDYLTVVPAKSHSVSLC